MLLHYLEKQERYETAAVITLTEREAERAFVWLSSRLKDKKADGARLTLLDKNSSRFCRGLTVTTFYLAKGIEFDQVFALRKENSSGPWNGRQTISAPPGPCMNCMYTVIRKKILDNPPGGWYDLFS